MSRLFRRRTCRATKLCRRDSRRRWLPRLEILEDRTVPSTLSMSGSTLAYTEQGGVTGHRIDVIFTPGFSTPGTYTFVDTGETITTFIAGSTGNGTGTVTVSENGVASVILNSSDTSDQVQVESNNEPLTVAGQVNNAVIIGSSSHDVQGIRQFVNISNSGGGTLLTVDDSGDSSPRTATIDFGTITGLAPAPISYQNFSLNALTVNGGSGGNTFTVAHTPNVLPTILNTGTGLNTTTVQATSGPLTIDLQGSSTGNDTVNIGDAGNTLNGIQGQVTLHGQSAASDTLSFNDQGNAVSNTTYTITATNFIRTNTAQVIYDMLAVVNVSVGSGGNTIDVDSTAVGTTYNISIGSSSDAVNFNNVASLPGSVNINNSAALSVLTVDDTSDASGASGTVAAANMSLNSGAVQFNLTYNQVNTLILKGGGGTNSFTVNATFPTTNVDLGSGNNSVNVNACNPGTVLSIFGNGGSDSIAVTVPNVQGTVTVNNTINATALTLDDSGDTAARSPIIGTNQVTGLGSGQFNYNGLSSFTIDGGSGGNTFTISDPPSTTVLNSGTGANTITILRSNGVTVNLQSALGVDTVTLGGSATAVVAQINGTVAALTLDAAAVNMAGGSLTLNGDITSIQSGLTSTIGGSIDLGGATRTITTAAGTPIDLQIDAAIGGSGSLIKMGPGSLVLTGTNTYTGDTMLEAGTLAAGGDQALSSGALALDAGLFESATAVTLANSFTANGGSLGGSNDFTLTGPGNLVSTLPVQNDAGTITLAGLLTGSGGLTKSGNGTLVVTGNNTCSGEITVQSGAVTASGSNALGTGMLMLTGGMLQALGPVQLDNSFNCTGFATLACLGAGNDLTINGTGNLDQQLVIDCANTITLSGQLTGSSGLTKMGSGTLMLTGIDSNLYQGDTMVMGGTIELAKTGGALAISSNLTVGDGTDAAQVMLMGNDQIASSALIAVNDLGVLDLNGNSNTIASLTITAGTVMTETGVLRLNGNVSSSAAGTTALIQGNLDLNGQSRTFTTAVGSTGGIDLQVDAKITGSGSLMKMGPGLLALTADNTYAGQTMVEQGTLFINGSQPGSNVNVGPGAVLGGVGTTGSVVIRGGTLSPGDAPGTLTAQDLALDPFSVYAPAFNNPTPGTGFSQVMANGMVDLGGSMLNIMAAPTFQAPPNSMLTLIQSTGMLMGTFANAPNGGTITIGGSTFRILYDPHAVILMAAGSTPTSTITFPGTGPYSDTSWPGAITGTALDDASGSGLASVGVSIFDSNLYWNGTAFASTTLVFNAAALTGTSWSYAFPASQLTDGQTYTVQSRATDRLGNQEAASAGATFTFLSTQNSATLTGRVFQDINTNGAQDQGEPGVAGTIVFLDLDGSGMLKTGDPTATTDANGDYQLTVQNAGTYTVREVLQGGVLVTSPASGSYPVTVATGATVSGNNFANVPTSIAVPLTLPLTTPFPKQGNANADYVEAIYRAVLNRDAEKSGLDFWTNLLNSGTLSRLQVVQGIRTSPEHFTQEVTDFYFTLLGRAPDASGLQFWTQSLQSGLPEEQMAFDFLDSPEFLSKGDKFFIDHMYLSLLGRTFDTSGEAFWLSLLGDDLSGQATHPATLTHEQVITDFLRSPESLNRLVEGYYQIFLQRLADPEGLAFWLTGLQQGQSFLIIGQDFLIANEFYNQAAAQG